MLKLPVPYPFLICPSLHAGLWQHHQLGPLPVQQPSEASLAFSVLECLKLVLSKQSQSRSQPSSYGRPLCLCSALAANEAFRAVARHLLLLQQEGQGEATRCPTSVQERPLSPCSTPTRTSTETAADELPVSLLQQLVKTVS